VIGQQSKGCLDLILQHGFATMQMAVK